MKLPQRKGNRLRGYDYRSTGAYFVTVCVKKRACLLGRVVGADARIGPPGEPPTARVALSAWGRIVEKHIRALPGLAAYVVMPNHFHILLDIPQPGGAMQASPPTSIPQTVRMLKNRITLETGRALFQRSFYDHIVRDEKEYWEIYRYIETNPQKWMEDRFYQKGGTV